MPSRRTKIQPGFVKEQSAADYCEMSVAEFRSWADAVGLEPCNLAGMPRYSIATIDQIAQGMVSAPEEAW